MAYNAVIGGTTQATQQSQIQMLLWEGRFVLTEMDIFGIGADAMELYNA